MIFTENRKRWTAGLIVGALALSMAAVPAAEAGNGKSKGRRYKGGESSRTVYHQYPVRRTVVRRSGSGAGPVIAGFIGGLAVGAILGSQSSRPAYAAPAPAADDYYYYDPYCESRYASLDLYATHVRQCSHPRVVRVYDIGSNSCVDTYRYEGGRWADYAGYDDSHRDSYRGGRSSGDRYGSRDREWNQGRDRGCDNHSYNHRHDAGCSDGRGRSNDRGRGKWDDRGGGSRDDRGRSNWDDRDRDRGSRNDD